MPEILEAYTWLTGRTALPPLWSLGYHQSRWFRYTQEAVEQLAQRHRDSAIPCDAIWLDIEYMDGYRVLPKRHLAADRSKAHRQGRILPSNPSQDFPTNTWGNERIHISSNSPERR